MVAKNLWLDFMLLICFSTVDAIVAFVYFYFNFMVLEASTRQALDSNFKFDGSSFSLELFAKVLC